MMSFVGHVLCGIFLTVLSRLAMGFWGFREGKR
jgi:hypothetical protein